MDSRFGSKTTRIGAFEIREKRNKCRFVQYECSICAMLKEKIVGKVMILTKTGYFELSL